jgi:DNA-binding response OmpR family regulator
MRALVVDDDASLRDGLVDALAAEGWQVSGAADGRSALEQLACGPVDVVVIDLAMPVMDGRELRRRLRASERHARVPMVVLSASEACPWPLEGDEVAMRKPFDLGELLSTLERLVHRRSP